jgi:hypothetical protein
VALALGVATANVAMTMTDEAASAAPRQRLGFKDKTRGAVV